MAKPLEDPRAKQQWLAQRLKNFSTKQSSFGITPQARPPALPLSFAQQRLWFLEQWEPGSTAYLLSYAWQLQGPLDVAALEASLTTLAERHESLRTTFSLIDDQPVQVIGPIIPFSLPLRDLTDLPEEARDAELTGWLEEEPHRPFDLTTGPLWRAQLLCLGSDKHVLLFTIHHITTDGWSMGILFKELSTLYTAQVTGQPAPLSPLPLHYADFAIWQRQWLQGDLLDRQLTYWHTQLAEAPHYLDFPTDSPRPPQQTYRGDRIPFTLLPSLTEKLKRLSQQEGVTLFMTLLAAFKILLARYTSQCDILVGTPIAGRTHTELEGLIGFFVNTLVLRTQFKGKPTFHDILQQVRDTCLDAYSHQDLPFEKLVESLQLVRDPSRHPLIQTMFQVHQADSTAPFTLLGLETTPIPSTSSMAKFDLHLALTNLGESLTGCVVFNTDLFAPPTMARFTKHFQVLLAAIVENPSQVVSQIPLLTNPERHQLLVEWNPSVLSDQSAICVHQLFEAQAVRTPEAVAVVGGEEQVTYAQLNQRATQLAHYLIRQRIELDARVGVCLERGVDFIVSLLAILKAGGAYVPLDPAAPQARLRFMLEDAKVGLVLTSAALKGRLEACLIPLESSDSEGTAVIALDMKWPDRNHKGLPRSCPEVYPENLAYVMYTSGSTGQPKGVGIPHRGVVRLVRDPTYLQEPSPIVCLQLASPTFDAATFEIWACLVNGGKLILSPPTLPSLSELGALLQCHQITTLWLTAGLFHQMVDWDLLALGPIQRLLAGGDVLSPFHVKRVVEQLPNCQLINGYGPTENTTFTCCFPIPLAGNFGNFVPIGRPIAYTQVYVLDAQQQLVARGVAGELCIGGLGLARGYFGHPGLTAEKFIPHPFSTVPGARLYRSGDIARYRPDGTIDFLGRRDHQVKIRGYRIECGEIETILTTHQAVKEVLVLPREDSAGNRRLVAYIVPESGSAPQISEFRDFLRKTLPSYMIPAGFVFLEAFPLTSNGKVNKRLLPVEDQRSSQEEGTYVAPRNSLESQLTKIWETVLGRQPIGVTDNFFNLGGESLMAVRLCSEIERALHKKIPVPTIFHAQTIEQLAKKMEQREENKPSPLMVPIQTSGSNPPIFCVLLGASFMPFMKKYPNQPLHMFFNQGHDGRRALYTTVEEITNWYLKEMRTIQPKGPYYLAGYSFGGMVVFEMAQQLRKQGETVGLLALVDPTTGRPQRVPSSSWANQVGQLLTPSPQVSNRWSNYLAIFSTVIWPRAFRAIQWRLKDWKNISRVTVKRMICNIFFRFDYPIPASLRQFYRTRVVQQAARKYIPQYYPGQIVIFQTKKNVESYWSKLCAEVLQVYDFPVEHLDLVDGPHTETLLQKLMNCLEKAQKNRNKARIKAHEDYPTAKKT